MKVSDVKDGHRLSELINDCANDDVHWVREKIEGVTDDRRRERKMKEAAARAWPSTLPIVTEELAKHHDVSEPDAELLEELRVMHEDYYIDAASWSDYD